MDSIGYILKSLTKINILAIVQKDVFAKSILNILNYPLASDKIEVKREMLSEYQQKIADLDNIPISNVKKRVRNFFDKENYVLHYEN